MYLWGGSESTAKNSKQTNNRSNRIMIVVMGVSGNNSSLPKNLKLLNDDRQRLVNALNSLQLKKSK